MPTAGEPPAARGSLRPRVELEGIQKAFRGVPVLREVALSLRAGEILGLVGENGAGKSTLMNVLGGAVQPDAGRMRVEGADYTPRSPADARAAGIAFVHQELTLFPNLTIAENLHLARFPRRGGLPWIDRRASARLAAALLDRAGLRAAPSIPVERLSLGERQLVEIARALGAQARVLILDEPTTSLGAADRDRLHALVEELAGQGLSVVYISHELGDVLRLCHRVAVLRDGAVVAAGPAAGFNIDRLVSLMVGREVRQLYPGRRTGTFPHTPLLEVRGVSAPGVVRDISFTVHRGELLGIFGLMGAGRSELARMLFGLVRHTAGEVRLEGRRLSGGPQARIRRGMAFVTEDRRLDGLCLESSIESNLVLVSLRAFARTLLRVVDRRRARAAADAVRRDVHLTGAATHDAPAGRLSGGNQQKVVLGKWLLARPRLLVLDEPTRGIDVAARAEIYGLMRRLAEEGAGLLVISSELEELMGLCGRILVMREGEIGGEFGAAEFDRERLLKAALPVRVA